MSSAQSTPSRWSRSTWHHVSTGRGSAELAGAARGAADVRPAARAVAGDDARGDLGGLAGAGERDNGAPEAGARHPRGKRAARVRELDEAVELGDRDLEVVAEALVTLAEEIGELGDSLRAQRLDDGANACVLRLDVAAPAGEQRVVRLAGAAQRLLELVLPQRVLRALEAPGDARVDHDDRDVLRQLDRLVLERAGVEEQRAACAAEDGGRLIHDPARHAHRAKLGALRGLSEQHRVEVEVGDSAERDRNRDLERR